MGSSLHILPQDFVGTASLGDALYTCWHKSTSLLEEALGQNAARRVRSYIVVNVDLVYIDISESVGKGSSDYNTWSECQAANNEQLWHTGASIAEE